MIPSMSLQRRILNFSHQSFIEIQDLRWILSQIHFFNDFHKEISQARPNVSNEDSNTRSAIPAFLLRNYCLLDQIRWIILVKCAKMQAMFYCKIFNIYGAKMLGKVTKFPRMKLQWNSWVKKRLPPIRWWVWTLKLLK